MSTPQLLVSATPMIVGSAAAIWLFVHAGRMKRQRLRFLADDKAAASKPQVIERTKSQAAYTWATVSEADPTYPSGSLVEEERFVEVPPPPRRRVAAGRWDR